MVLEEYRHQRLEERMHSQMMMTIMSATRNVCVKLGLKVLGSPRCLQCIRWSELANCASLLHARGRAAHASSIPTRVRSCAQPVGTCNERSSPFAIKDSNFINKSRRDCIPEPSPSLVFGGVRTRGWRNSQMGPDCGCRLICARTAMVIGLAHDQCTYADTPWRWGVV